MKKLFILTLSCALLLAGCGFRTVSQTVGEVLATAPELARVETVSYWLNRVTTEYPDGTSVKKIYDSDFGPNTNSCTYYENGEEIGTDEYTRDDHGNIISVTTNWDGGENRTYAYTYDENGNILTEEAFLDGQSDYTTEYTYSKAGTLSKKVVTPSRGLRAEYLYDELGRETERLDYDGDTLQHRTVTEYADHGKRAKVTICDSNGNVTYWEDYSYDEKSSIETVLEYSADGELLRKLINTYNAWDLLMMQEVYTSGGDLISTTYWYYVPSKVIDYVEVTEPTE